MSKKLLLLAIIPFYAMSVMAQPDMVTLYEQCNYAGSKHMLAAGTYRLYQMKVDNDKLSSMIIPNGMKVTIYVDDKFEGASKTYYANTSCLEDGWRNTASSLVVEKTYSQQTHYGQNDYVTFFNDCNSKGYSQSLPPGNYTGSQLGALRYNISSFTITGNLQVRYYLNNESLSGASGVYESNVTCLPGYQNDNIGSLTIEYKTSTTPTYPNNNGNNGNNGYNGNNGNSNYATIYTDCNFNGNSLRLEPGYYQGNKLGLLKYNISSIKLPSNLSAKVYINNENLSGTYYSLTNSVNCMSTTMNDRIGSLLIEENNGYNQNQYPPNNNNYNNYEKVILYADKDYKGLSASLLPGTYSTMVQAGFYDKALSSLTVPAGYRVVIYEQENFKGKSFTITASRSGFTLTGWNDKASSIAVYRDQ